MAAGHFKIGYGAHSMFLLDSSALEPTSDCQRLNSLQPQGFICARHAQQPARAGRVVCGSWKQTEGRVSKKGVAKTISQGI